MKRSFTQKELYELLCTNPLNVDVHIGDLDDMQGKDYIFLDFINDIAIGYDDNGDYQTIIQISVATKDFEKRITLTEFIKKYFFAPATYSKDSESEYYIAQFTLGVFIHK